MATLTIKNIPESVYRTLKRQAVQRRRSLNQEIIARLEQSTGAAPLDTGTFLAHARELRKLVKGRPMTERRLKQLKSTGRL